jgi:hypothetical protein
MDQTLILKITAFYKCIQNWKDEDQFPVEGRYILSFFNIQKASWDHPAAYPMDGGKWTIFGDKMAGT